MKKIYVSGAMNGQPYYNFPRFNAAAEALRLAGWFVYNPAEHDIEVYGSIFDSPTGDPKHIPDFDLRAALRWDMKVITGCDAIYMLKGWEYSSGAIAEWYLARALRLEFIYE